MGYREVYRGRCMGYREVYRGRCRGRGRCIEVDVGVQGGV